MYKKLCDFTININCSSLHELLKDQSAGKYCRNDRQQEIIVGDRTSVLEELSIRQRLRKVALREISTILDEAQFGVYYGQVAVLLC